MIVVYSSLILSFTLWPFFLVVGGWRVFPPLPRFPGAWDIIRDYMKFRPKPLQTLVISQGCCTRMQSGYNQISPTLEARKQENTSTLAQLHSIPNRTLVPNDQRTYWKVTPLARERKSQHLLLKNLRKVRWEERTSLRNTSFSVISEEESRPFKHFHGNIIAPGNEPFEQILRSV